MKQVVDKLTLFIVLCIAVAGFQAAAQSTYTLTANGIGPVQIGVKAIELPESVPNLYDSKVSDVYIDEEIPDDEDMPEFATWYFYDEDGEVVFTATQDSEGYISEINISSPKFLTPEGIHVGTPQQRLDKIKGAMRIDPDPMADETYARLSYVLNGITYWIDGFYIDDDHSEDRIASITISDPVLTAEGIGPVRIGTKASDLPESSPRLYASRILGNGKTTPKGNPTDWHFLDDNGNELFTAEQDDEGQISQITITTPSINTFLGVHPGMSLQQVEELRGEPLEKPLTNDAYNSYDLYDIALNVNQAQENLDKNAQVIASMSIPGLTDIMAQNVADTHNRIIVYFNQSNTLNELAQHIEEIRQMPQVEDVYTNDETTMFVKYKEFGTFTYSYFQQDAEIKESVSTDEGNRPTGYFKIKDEQKNYKNIVYANQMKKDFEVAFIQDQIQTNKRLLFQECGFEKNEDIVEMDPSLKFFAEDMFNFDIVLLNTHGFYDKKTGLHWLLTSESIDVGDYKAKDITMIKSAYTNDNVPIDNQQTKIIDTHKEKRIIDGEEVTVPITYVAISENYIKNSERKFKNSQGAIVFNTACESLKAGENNDGLSMAKAFLAKKACLYLGYSEIHTIELAHAFEYFSRVLSGLSLKVSFDYLSDNGKSCDKWRQDPATGVFIYDGTTELKSVSVHPDFEMRAFAIRPEMSYFIDGRFDGNSVKISSLNGFAFYDYYNTSTRTTTRNGKEDKEVGYEIIPQNQSPVRYGFEVSKTPDFPQDETTRAFFFDELDNVELDNNNICKFSGDFEFPSTARYYNKDKKDLYVRAFIYADDNKQNRNYSWNKIHIVIK